MKLTVVVVILLGGLCGQVTRALPVPPGQYCPVVSDFDLRPDVLYPGDYFMFYQSLPGSFTAVRTLSIDETARIIHLTGRAYIIGTGIPLPNPVAGNIGPVTSGPYRLVVEFYYAPAPNVIEFCPVLDIPLIVGGSGAVSAPPVPAMSTWMLMALAGLLGGLGLVVQRRVRRRYSGQ